MGKPDGRFEFEVGYSLSKQFLSAKVTLPPLKKFNFSGAGSEGGVGGLTALLARWKASAAGKSDGKRGFPPRDANALSDKEQNIITRNKRRMTRTSELLGKFKQRLHDFVNDNKPQPVPEETLRQEFAARKYQIETFYKEEIERARQNKEDSQRTLQAFRDENGLRNRPAEYADVWLAPLAILLIAWVIDGFLNAWFFAGASRQGFIGGLIVAFALSAANIVIGFFAGMYGWRERGHINKIRQRVGWAVLGICILLGLLLNFFIAHFRDMAERAIEATRLDPSQPTVTIESIPLMDVFKHMGSAPLEFGSLYALLLLGSGLVVFFVAFMEGAGILFGRGHGFVDPYPGYASADRAVKKYRARYDSLVQHARDWIASFYDLSRLRINIGRRVHDHYKDQIESGAKGLDERFTRSRKRQALIFDHARATVAVYRKGNVLKRPANAPPPTYFNQTVTIDDQIPASFITADVTHSNDALSLIRNNISSLDRLGALINTQHQQAIAAVTGFAAPRP